MPNGLPGKKRSGLKLVFYFAGAFFCLCLILLLSLPTLLSTTTGKKIVVNAIKNRTGMQVEIDSLSLSWFGSQSLEGIRAQKLEQQLSFKCEMMRTDASLWRIGFKDDIGNLKITAPNLEISKPFLPAAILREKSLEAAAFAAVPKVELVFPEIKTPIHGQITVERGRVNFNPPGLEPIAFDQIAASVDMNPQEEIAISLNCSTIQQQNLGQIAIKASASNLNHDVPNLAIKATIEKMPTRGVDQLLSVAFPKLNGLLVSAVGSTLDLACNFQSSAGSVDLSFTAQSPQITAQIATQSVNGILSLKTPGTINFNVTPTFLQKLSKPFPALSQLSLTQPSLFQITLSQFSCPLPATQADLAKASFQASILAPPQVFLTLNGSPIALNRLFLQSDSKSILERINIHASSELRTQGEVGSFALDGFILALSNSGNFTLTAEKFPVDLVGTFISTPVPLSTLVGATTNLNCSLDLAIDQPKLHLSWNSASLSIPTLDISLNDTWTLISPASFTYGLTPDLFSAIFPDKKIQLANAEKIQGSIKNLVIHPDNVKNTYLNAVIRTGQIGVIGDFPLTITELQATLAIDTLEQISLQIDGEPIKASLSGSLHLDTQEFALNKPLTVQCTVDNALLKGINLSAPQLVQPAKFLLSLDPMTLPLFGLSLDKLKVKGQLTADQLLLLAQTEGNQIALQNLLAAFQWDGKGKTASLQLSSQVKNAAGGAGSMQGQFNFSNFSFEKGLDLSSAVVNGTFDLQNISSVFLDAFANNALPSALVGPSFSSKLKLQSTLDKQNLALKWTSPYLSIDSAFTIDNTGVQLQGSTNQIAWTLTPEGYKALDAMLTGPTKGMVPFEFKETSTFTIALSKMSLPVTPKKSISSILDRIPDIVFDLNALQLSLSGNNPKMVFFDKSSQEMIQLSALAFSLSKNAAQGPLNISCDSSIHTQSIASGTSTKSGSLSLAGRLETTLKADGSFDMSRLSGGLEFKVQQLPSRVLDIFARANGRTDFPFTTVFGNLINASLSLDLKNFNGPVSMNLNSPLTRASLTGTIANGALMLSEPIYAQLKITPEMSRLVLKEVNPLNLSYIYSKDPVTLEIPAQGFYFPLYPSNVEKIAIPEATIELGKISCRNEGNVNIALGLLKTKQFDKNNDLTLWFAPIELSVQKGFVNIDRTEILLADTFDICIWGKVDLVKDYVDMLLGLTAQTLSKAFGIKNLPEKYVLTIPMKGPADNVQINTGKATAKVALLLAWQQKDLAGAIKGPAGAIVGELMKKVATLPDFDAKVPPAKHPFPWEVGQKPKKTSEDSHEKKRHFKQNEKPLKQILKVIK